MSVYRAPEPPPPRPQHIYSYEKRVARTRGKRWLAIVAPSAMGLVAGAELFAIGNLWLGVVLGLVAMAALAVVVHVWRQRFDDSTGAPSSEDMDIVDAPKSESRPPSS